MQVRSLPAMVRRARNEPARRILRAARQARLAEKAEEDLYSDSVTAPARKSEVLARTKPGQSKLERRNPARVVVLSFVGLSVAGAILLMLPGMTAEGHRTPFLTALFTSVSASCVTGLSTVDTATYWSHMGQVTILALIQVGGFGIQALGTVVLLLLNRRMNTQSRQAAQAEVGALTPGDVRRMLKALAVITVTVEASVAAFLTLRFWLEYDMPLRSAAWNGVFHAISAFNNAGFALASDSLMTKGQDALILVPLSIAVVLGGLGFLVILEIFTRATGARGLRPRRKYRMSPEDVIRRGRALSSRSRYRLGDSHPERLGFGNPIPLSLHARMMLLGTGLLMVVGTAMFALFEWGNAGTLGPMSFPHKVLNAVFSGAVTPRTAGFNSIDYEQVRSETRLLTDGLMFVGAGSGSTGGGIKVTTLMVVLIAALAEARGHKDVNFLSHRIPDSTVRIAVAVIMVSATAIMTATMALIALSELSLDLALFEVVSAMATVGLTAGATPDLPAPAQSLIIVCMLVGRVGPLTLVSALSLRHVARAYRLPEGRPMIG